MKATDLCPPPHLEAADFETDTEVTIKSVDFGEVGDEKVTKGIVFFEEYKRGLVLNRTNLKRIIAQHGGETDDWAGKKITLYPSETDFGGKTVDCIRVRERR
jgi:hypothetical protein